MLRDHLYAETRFINLQFRRLYVCNAYIYMHIKSMYIYGCFDKFQLLEMLRVVFGRIWASKAERQTLSSVNYIGTMFFCPTLLKITPNKNQP